MAAMRPVSTILSALSSVISYRKFFNGTDKRHVPLHVGLAEEGKCVTLASAISAADGNAIFLKIDAEGSEYRMLDDLIKYQDSISGAVIEFHDVDLHLSRIEQFVNVFPLRIGHIHVNNSGSIAGEGQTPTTLEITFTRHAELTSVCLLPHPLDMLNMPERRGIVLEIDAEQTPASGT